METKQKDNRYGFLTTFSLIFAGVVGVGIFFKGESVMNLTHSAMLMLLAWILISVVAMGLAYAYIEISSSTVQSEKSEQGSLYKWSSLFLSKKFGAFVGIFYCFFYMPLNLIALALISSRMFINLFVGVGGEATKFLGNVYEEENYWATQNKEAQQLYLILVYIGAMMVVFFCIAVNAFGTKFSKITQSFGTVFKIFSLLAIIGVIFYGVFSGLHGPAETSPDNPVIEGKEWANSFTGGKSASIPGFFLALPAVMFSFDAFVQTGTLQSDTKSKNTFSRALISAMSIITIMYLFIILGSGLIRNATGYDLPGLITEILGGESGFKVFLLVLITISGITAANSWFIFLGRTISDLADHHEILNPNNDLQYQHKATGAYTHSYRLVLTILSIYLLTFLALDVGLFPYASPDSYAPGEATVFGVFATDAAKTANTVDVRNVAGNIEIASNDLIVMLMYGVYGLIVFGGVRNRKSNKVKVDKSKAFMPVAIFSISLLAIVIVLYFISVPLAFTSVMVSEEDKAAGYTGASVADGNNNFGTFWALPIDIVMMLIVTGIWYVFDQYFHVSGKKEKIDSKINSMKSKYEDFITSIENKVGLKKGNKKEENDQNNDSGSISEESLRRTRVHYSINYYKLRAQEVG